MMKLKKKKIQLLNPIMKQNTNTAENSPWYGMLLF